MEVNYVGKSDVHVRLVILICVCVCVLFCASMRVVCCSVYCHPQTDLRVKVLKCWSVRVCVCVRLCASIRVIIWDIAFCRVKNDEHVTLVTMCACVCACNVHCNN